MQNVNIDKSVKLFAGEKAFLGKNERGLFIPAPAGLCRPLTVCVHDGQFHADELVCIAMLDLFGKTEVDVVRSRKPADWERADLVIDVRFLPNPFYIDALCRHSGLDEDVRTFVMEHPVTKEFMIRWKDLLSFLIPHYKEEGKHRVVIAVGCTGGAHRSVAIAEAIGQFLREQGMPTEINHRDLILEQARWSTPVEEGES